MVWRCSGGGGRVRVPGMIDRQFARAAKATPEDFFGSRDAALHYETGGCSRDVHSYRKYAIFGILLYHRRTTR